MPKNRNELAAIWPPNEPEVLGLLAREPLSPTIWEIEADALRMPEGLQ